MRRPAVLGWIPLLALKVRHGYFAAGVPRRLRFQADADTARFIRRHQLIERIQGGELWLHAPQQGLAGLCSEREQTLVWRIVSDDPEYAFYTDPRAPESIRISLADDLAGWREAPADRTRPPRSVEIAIAPRRVTWKYLLLGDWRTDAPALAVSEDGSNIPVSFRQDEDESLPDGLRARVFRSSHRLPLGVSGPQHITLLDLGARSPRVLQARMPLAAPRGLSLERRLGRTRPVCEIFVHP
jgi:hypothetical protein